MAARNKRAGKGATAPVTRNKGAQREVRYSRLQPPAGLEPEDWQVALRRQFGREQAFGLDNLGDDPVFSEFRVTNPQSGDPYRVAIRGTGLGENFCSCPDFATNALGTCKHIEFTLARLRRGAAARRRCERGFHAAVQRGLPALRRARAGALPRRATECPPALAPPARRLFDEAPAGSLRRAASAARRLPRSCRASRARAALLRRCARLRRRAARRRQRGARCSRRRFPTGAKSAALQKLLKVPLYDYQAEGALFAARAGRCLIGDEMGLGKTDPGHRRRRDPGPALRRRARAGRLPHLAQAPVAARDRPLHRPHGAGRSAAACGRAPEAVRASPERLQDHQLRHGPARPRPDRRLGARTW